MIFEKGERSCTGVLQASIFEKGEDFGVFCKGKSTYNTVSAFFGIRRLHTLPGRVQPSTICVERLNFCVRYENRWTPFAIATEMVECF